MQSSQWKLFHEIFIYLNITTLADIVTACGKFITKEAYQGIKSYESIHKWPHQQHFISNAHRELWTKCKINITQRRSRQLRQPLGAWTTTPTTIQPYRMAGNKLLVQQKDGSWLQHDQCLNQQQNKVTRDLFWRAGEPTQRASQRAYNSRCSALRNHPGCWTQQSTGGWATAEY